MLKLEFISGSTEKSPKGDFYCILVDMKNLVSILISVIVFYLFFIVLIKSTNFKEEQVYIQYNNEGLSQFADSLVAKKIIFEKIS